MSTTNIASQPCQCLRTKNPYGTTPQDVESWLPGVRHFFELLVPADDGSCRT